MVDSGIVQYPTANLHVAIMLDCPLTDDTDTSCSACIRPLWRLRVCCMLQNTILVCGLIYPACLMTVLPLSAQWHLIRGQHEQLLTDGLSQRRVFPVSIPAVQHPQQVAPPLLSLVKIDLSNKCSTKLRPRRRAFWLFYSDPVWRNKLQISAIICCGVVIC